MAKRAKKSNQPRETEVKARPFALARPKGWRKAPHSNDYYYRYPPDSEIILEIYKIDNRWLVLRRKGCCLPENYEILEDADEQVPVRTQTLNGAATLADHCYPNHPPQPLFWARLVEQNEPVIRAASHKAIAGGLE